MSGMDNPEVLLAVIDSLTLGVSLVNPQGKIVLWNRHAEQLTGYLRQDALGRSVREGFLGWTWRITSYPVMQRLR